MVDWKSFRAKPPLSENLRLDLVTLEDAFVEFPIGVGDIGIGEIWAVFEHPLEGGGLFSLSTGVGVLSGRVDSGSEGSGFGGVAMLSSQLLILLRLMCCESGLYMRTSRIKSDDPRWQTGIYKACGRQV